MYFSGKVLFVLLVAMAFLAPEFVGLLAVLGGIAFLAWGVARVACALTGYRGE